MFAKGICLLGKWSLNPNYSVIKRFNRTLRKKMFRDTTEEDNLPVVKYPYKKPGLNILYVWGFGEHGGLGHYFQEINRKKNSSGQLRWNYVKPLRHNFGEKHRVTHIAAGFGFSLFAVKGGKWKVYGTGINTDSQLGCHEHKGPNSFRMLANPAPLNISFKDEKKTKITGLAAGRAHSVIVTDNEGVYILGNNYYGQCGRKFIKDENYEDSHIVHNIPDLDGLKIMSVVCGQDHTLFLMEDGSVYSCGLGADGQTGLGHYSNVDKPTKVLGDIKGEKIVKLSSKGDSVLAINDKGQVFGWGSSEYGELFDGASDLVQSNVPIQLRKCNGFGKIVDVAASGSSCLMLNENGDVFSWGFGILGQGPKASSSFNPTIIPPTLFGRNELTPDVRVEKIFCGMFHSAAITDRGTIYMWGKNKSGSLGLGNKNDQFFPFRVCVGYLAKTMSLGVDHTLALCGSF